MINAYISCSVIYKPTERWVVKYTKEYGRIKNIKKRFRERDKNKVAYNLTRIVSKGGLLKNHFAETKIE